MSNSINVEKITAVNFYDLSPTFNTKIHKHNEWEMFYVDSGEVNCISESDSRMLKAGDVVFHRPNTLHNTVCNGKRSATMFNVLFLCDSPSIEFFNSKSFSVPDGAVKALKELMQECSATYKISEYPILLRDDAPCGGEQMARILLERLLLLLIRECEEICFKSTMSIASLESSNGFIDEICNYMREHIYGKLSLDNLTQRFHFGKSFLCEQFKRSTGSPPISYYLDLKLNEAKRLLREDDLTVSEISEMLGFESNEYFSRYFKKRVGHSPRAFRKMLINDASLRKLQ